LSDISPPHPLRSQPPLARGGSPRGYRYGSRLRHRGPGRFAASRRGNEWPSGFAATSLACPPCRASRISNGDTASVAT